MPEPEEVYSYVLRLYLSYIQFDYNRRKPSSFVLNYQIRIISKISYYTIYIIIIPVKVSTTVVVVIIVILTTINSSNIVS